MTLQRITVLILLIVLAFILAGCNPPPPRKRVLWPVYPATPRIEWLGTFSSQDDFPKTGKQIFSEGILGKIEPQIFKSPYGIVSDSQGIIYIADTLDSNLRVYDFSAQTVKYFTKDVLFSRPADLAVDAADNLYVVDSDVGTVLVFNKERRPLRSFGSPKELLSPSSIAIDEVRGRFYVSTPRANKIVIYDRFGIKTGEIGEGAMGKGLSSPQGMAIDKEGNLFVAEFLGAKISVFDTQGNYLRSFGARGDAVYQFEAPKDLAFDSDGNLWVTDVRRAQIYTYTPDGKLLLATGTSAPTSDPLGFSSPTSIFIDRDDKIYITDRINRRFSVWRYFSDRYLKEHPFSAEEQKYLQEVGRAAALPSAQLTTPVQPVGPVKSATP